MSDNNNKVLTSQRERRQTGRRKEKAVTKPKDKQAKPPQRKVEKKIDINALVEKRDREITGLNSSALAFESKHNVRVPRNVSTKAHHRLGFFMQLLDAKVPGTGALKQRVLSLTPTEVKALSTFKQEMTHMIFGTQEPELKLFSIWQYINTSIGGNLTSDAYPIQWGGANGIQDSSSWAVVFDEVKMIHGEMTYHGARYNNSDGASYYVSVGAIDYDDASSTTFTNLSEYDTREFFNINLFPGSQSHPTWKWHSQGQPDLAWITTADTSTIVCWWKLGLITTLTSSVTYGTCQFYAYVRFRQVV